MVRRIGSVFGLVLVFIGLLLGLQGDPESAEGAEAASYRDLGITHGAHLRPTFIPGTPNWGYGKEILAFNDLVDKDIGVIMYFSNWDQNGSIALIDPFLLNLIQNEISDPTRRPAIMITWEPTRTLGGSFLCTKSYTGVIPPADIIAGNCDAYLIQFANDIKARPERFLLRFAHEMNITDSPWW
ncbi:MAG: hypothetical protein WBB65_08330, partial [Anaerolineales bacterium]